mgnify:CR=1 FL=1
MYGSTFEGTEDLRKYLFPEVIHTSEIDRIRKLFYVYSTCTVHVTCTLYTYTYGSRKYFRTFESTKVLPYFRIYERKFSRLAVSPSKLGSARVSLLAH